MDVEQWSLAQEVFHEIVDQPFYVQVPWLLARCSGNEEIVDQVLRMLEEDRREAGLLDSEVSPAVSSLLNLDMTKLPEQAFGPYRLVRLLGEGGMGVVYLAEREDLGSKAAVKILRDASLSPMRRQRFLVEQRMLAQLNHPSIARLYDADTLEDGTPYIVMEYVEGLTLTAYVEQNALSVEKRVDLFRSICEATRYAHAQGIIHRDLKPSNILVTSDGIVKLVDFGIAKQLENALEDHGSATTSFRLLTPAYAAPEQIKGEAAGIQADVYSLGVIFYELLAGRLPYDLSNHSPAEMEAIVLDTHPVPPSTISRLREVGADTLSIFSRRELDTVSLTAMHKDLQRRYQSAEALIRDVDHYLSGQPLEARPDSIVYRARKFGRRNQHALVLSAAFVVIAIVATLFVAFRLAKARRDTLAEAARTQQIQQFMLNLFNAGDKQTAPSDELRVVTLLDRGAQQARTLDRDPETQAELYQTLAGIYQNLGKFDRADPLLHSALEKRQQIYGPQSSQVADTMTALGLLRLEQAKPDEAERLTRDALALDQRLLPPADLETSKAMSALGRVLVEKGSYAEAVPLLQNAIKLQSVRPEDQSALAVSLGQLATADYYQANYADADRLNRDALAIDKKQYGETNPRVADDYVDIGEIQHEIGHDADAEQFYREALQIKKAWYGEQHPDTAFCMMALGQALIYEKRYDDAFPLVQRSVEIQEQVFGKSHPRVAMAYNQIGVLELRRGHFDAAEDYFSRMLRINQLIYGQRHMLVGASMLNLAEVYLEHKQFVRAEASFREAIDVFRQTLPTDHPYITIGDAKLGETLVLDRKYREAEAPLVEGYHLLGKQTKELNERLAGNIHKDLAAVYQHLGESDKLAALGAKTVSPGPTVAH